MIETNRIKHKQWGLGTKLYELAGGYELLVNFDNYGKIQVVQRDCEEVTNDVKLEKINEEVTNDVKLEKISEEVTNDVKLDQLNDNILKCMNLINEKQNGILKNEIISQIKISEDVFNEILPKILRLEEYNIISNDLDSENFRIKFTSSIENSKNSEKKKIIEAFRLGIVPGFVVQNITVGRKKEIKKVEEWLEKDSESLMIIGQYGQGKSHIIRYIREKALDDGYLVAYCDIGEESQMHKPKSVFNTLMKSLVFRDKKGNEKGNDLSYFLRLYAKYLADSTLGAQNINKFLKRGIEYLVYRIKNNHPVDNPYFRSFIDYLCGDEINSRDTYRFNQKIAIHPFQTSASIICNILSSIGSMAASIKDDSEYSFKELILIFDEGESIDSPAYLSKQRDGGINFIKGLAEISNNNEDLLSERHNERDQQGYYRGSKTNLMYSGMDKNTRFCDQKENHVKCLFAFVEGESEVIDILKKQGVEKIVLNDFTNDEKNQLIYKILEIYKKAYAYEVNDVKKFKNIIMNKLKNSNNTRSIIKITVEALDLIRINPNNMDYKIILRDRRSI